MDGAGVHSVRESGARGDGIADGTEALRAAFQECTSKPMRTVCLPNGTCLVSPLGTRCAIRV